MAPIVEKINAAKQALRSANIERVERQFAKTGSKPDPAVVRSAAKFNETLKKLARE